VRKPVPPDRESYEPLAKWLLAGLLFLNFVTRLLILIRPLLFLDNLPIRSFFVYSLISDDAYLCLKIAKNLALGLGPTFDGISYTNGFQPLYVFLMAPVFRVFPHDLFTPARISLLILSVFDTLSLFLFFKICRRLVKSAWAPIIVALFWVFNPYVISTTLNGMETMLGVFFVLLFLYFYDSDRSFLNGRRPFLLGVILGSAMLARIDSVFLGFALFLTLTFGWLRRDLTAGRYLKTLLLVALGAVLVYSPWLVHSYAFTGEVFPVSGKAIRLITLSSVSGSPTVENLYLPMLLKGLKTVWFGNAVPILLLFAATLAVILMGGPVKPRIKTILERMKKLRLLFLYVISLFLAYVLYFFAPYYFPRYLFPATLVFLFCLVVMIGLWLETATKRIHRVAMSVSVVAALIIMLVMGGFGRFFLSKGTNCCGYMNIGLWAGANLEPGSKVGSCQSGALGYFAENLKVINLDGVVNRPCYEALRNKRATEYIKEQGIEYVLGWVVNFDFLKSRSTDYEQSDFALVGKIPRYKSWDQEWYLTMVNYGQLDTLLDTGWLRKRGDSLSTGE
jgi:hypothetical protein